MHRDTTRVQRRQVRRTTIRSYLSLLGCGQEAKHNLTESHELLTIETAEIEQRWDQRWRGTVPEWSKGLGFVRSNLLKLGIVFSSTSLTAPSQNWKDIKRPGGP